MSINKIKNRCNNVGIFFVKIPTVFSMNTPGTNEQSPEWTASEESHLK